MTIIGLGLIACRNAHADLVAFQSKWGSGSSEAGPSPWGGAVRLDEFSGATNSFTISSDALASWEYFHKAAVSPTGDVFVPGGGLLNDKIIRFSGSSGRETGSMSFPPGINLYAVAVDSANRLHAVGVDYGFGNGVPRGWSVWVYGEFGGQPQRLVSIPDFHPTVPNTFNDIVVLPDGGIIVSDEYEGLLWSSPNSETFQPFAQSGSQVVTNATGLALGPDGNLYVSSMATDEVFRFDVHSYTNSPSSQPSFPLVDVIVSTAFGGLKKPSWLTFCGDGRLYAYGQQTGEILRYDVQTNGFVDSFIQLAGDLSGGILYAAPVPMIRSKPVQGNLVLEWSKVWTNYVAERSGDPSSASVWTPIAETPSLVGGSLVVTNTTIMDREFFRLRRQE